MLQDTSTTTRTRVRLSVQNIAVALTVFSLAAGFALGGFVFPGKKQVAGTPGPQAVSGRISTIVEDDFAHQTSRTIYLLTTIDGKLEYTLTGSQERLESLTLNAPVEVVGTVTDGTMSVHEQRMIEEPQGQPPEQVWSTLGERPIIALLVNFTDLRQQPYTVSQVEQILFTGSRSVDAFVRENSYDRAWVSGDVRGWFELPIPRTCNPSLAAIAAADPTVDFRLYDHLFVYTPYFSGCSPYGSSSMPWNTQDGQVWLTLTFINLYSPSDTYTSIHEFGHNLNLLHANALECGYVPIGEGCTAIEYGDKFSVMGETQLHHSGPHKERLQWFLPEQVQYVITSGTYRIEPTETPGTGVKMLRVPNGTRPGAPEAFFLEYRRPIGFDDHPYVRSYAQNGVLIHYQPPVNYASYLLDMTPNIFPSPPYNMYDFVNASLNVGQSYTNGLVTIRPVANDSSGIDVEVTLHEGVCVENNPTVTVDPSTLLMRRVNGQTAPANFSVLITNNNSSSCGPSLYSLNISGINGLHFIGNTSMNLMPGETREVEFTVSADDPFPPAGMYDVTITGISNANDSYRSSTHLLINFIELGGGGQSPVFLKEQAPFEAGTMD